jgi:hypothetical protein
VFEPPGPGGIGRTDGIVHSGQPKTGRIGPRPMRRIWPPEPERESSPVESDGVPLRDWCVRFEVTLDQERDAHRFARQYRMKFVRSAAVASGCTAWVTFRTGAADETDAALLAAITIRVVANQKITNVSPTAAKLHYADDLGEIFGPQATRLRADRQTLLSYAPALGLTRTAGMSADEPPARATAVAPKSPRRRLRMSRSA